jgi:uncharacterized protein YndB with AHSA1/START domain/DNA-binding transcriptional ArsR family regulator
MDKVFKALADPSRRKLLDQLEVRNGQTLRELCSHLDMARQSVMKHLEVLEGANLIATVRHSREKLHYLNTAPISEIGERWINRFDRQRVEALATLKRSLEDATMSQTEIVYVSYIQTTPQKLWRALTQPEFTLQYWGIGLESDWKVGSPVRLQWGPGEEFRDVGQVVLHCEPYRRLSYRWHTYQHAHAEMFGWSEEYFAQLLKERRSKVSFELEPAGPAVKLTVTHDDFEPDSEMLKGTRDGWPVILSTLKTLLETGTPMTLSPDIGSDHGALTALRNQ